jgi:hypothetical protein
MKLIAYQALLANQQNVALIRSRVREVERAGGRVEIAPPTKVGMVLPASSFLASRSTRCSPM